MSPPSLATLARRVLAGLAPEADALRLVVACSGGVDSQVLLEVLAHLRRGDRRGNRPLALIAVGVDHGLRAEAARELDGAESLATRLGVPFERHRVVVERSPSLQAAARRARLAVLTTVAERSRAHAIATAHHRDDRAETVLIRMLRGAPLGGLSVLAPTAPGRVRPLIAASRAEIERHARAHGLQWSEDPSNHDARYLRVRVRRELMPLLRALDPRIEEHLCRWADEAEAWVEAPQRAAIRARVPPASRRSVDALVAASTQRHRRAAVPLRGGLVGRWTEDGELHVENEGARRRTAAGSGPREREDREAREDREPAATTDDATTAESQHRRE